MIFFKKLSKAPKVLSLFLIRMYQKTLSPDHGFFSYKHPFGFCRYRPTCSEYSFDAISKKGFFKGLYFALRRILRCHPWSKGGWDPVR